MMICDDEALSRKEFKSVISNNVHRVIMSNLTLAECLTPYL